MLTAAAICAATAHVIKTIVPRWAGKIKSEEDARARHVVGNNKNNNNVSHLHSQLVARSQVGFYFIVDSSKCNIKRFPRSRLVVCTSAHHACMSEYVCARRELASENIENVANPESARLGVFLLSFIVGLRPMNHITITSTRSLNQVFVFLLFS